MFHRLFSNRLPSCVAMALVLLCSGWATANDGRKPDCFIVSAGIDHYPTANSLSGCRNDALNTVAAFRAQQGPTFNQVKAATLLDGQATLATIRQLWRETAQQGQAGDVMVLFLSGHGSNDSGDWRFLPFDYNPRRSKDTTLSDRDILETAETLADQGKTAVIIVDACYAGQLRVAAQPLLNRHRDQKGGGIVLMVSSGPGELSVALGDYSAFAKAFADSMTPLADADRDGKVTLDEISRHSRVRTGELLRQRGNANRQNSEVVWSPSISKDMIFARVTGLPRIDSNPIDAPTNAPPAPAPIQGQHVWNGSEDLPGFGRLAFQFHDNGQVVMTDAAGVREGRYRIVDQFIRLSFDGGRIEYIGVIRGDSMSGSAANERTTWTWHVEKQNRVRFPGIPSQN